MNPDWPMSVVLNLSVQYSHLGNLLKHPSAWTPPQTNYISICRGSAQLLTLKTKAPQLNVMLSEPIMTIIVLFTNFLGRLGHETQENIKEVGWSRSSGKDFYNEIEGKRNT